MFVASDVRQFEQMHSVFFHPKIIFNEVLCKKLSCCSQATGAQIHISQLFAEDHFLMLDSSHYTTKMTVHLLIPQRWTLSEERQTHNWKTGQLDHTFFVC